MWAEVLGATFGIRSWCVVVQNYRGLHQHFKDIQFRKDPHESHTSSNPNQLKQQQIRKISENRSSAAPLDANHAVDKVNLPGKHFWPSALHSTWQIKSHWKLQQYGGQLLFGWPLKFPLVVPRSRLNMACQQTFCTFIYFPTVSTAHKGW